MKKLVLIISASLLSLVTYGQEVLTFEEVKTKSEVSSVSFSTEGRLAVGTMSGEIELWNPLTKHQDNVLEGEKGTIFEMAFSSEPNVLASCGRDKEVYLWDVYKGIKLHSFAGHSGKIMSVSISHDGLKLATGGDDGKIIIWDVKTGEKLGEFTDHQKAVTKVEFAHRSNILASADMEGVIKLYDIDKMQLDRKLKSDEKKVRALSFSPNDKYLVTGGDGKVIHFWDVNMGFSKMNLQGHKKSILDLKFSPDGRFIASTGLDNVVKVWAVKEGVERYELKGFYNVVDCHFSLDGKMLAVADLNKRVRLYDMSPLEIREDNDLNIHAKNGLNNGGVLEPPLITMIHPRVSGDEVFQVEQENETITVKGNVKCTNGLFILLVGGKETKIDENGDFEQEVPLRFLENEVLVKAIDVDKQVAENTVKVFRVAAGITSGGQLKRSGRDYALCIGTDEYVEMNNLSNPVFDATTISDELRDAFGFESELLLNPTMDQIYTKLREYSLKKFSSEDQLFIFIAGHGEFDKVFNEGYLVCKDSKAKDLARSSYVSHSNLRTLVNNIKCEHVMLTLDVCFGGTFDPLTAHRGSESLDSTKRDQFILKKMNHKTRIYLTSGGKEYVPDGRPGYHSPFARKIIESLRTGGGKDQILTTAELFSNLEGAQPEPHFGQFGDNEPGSDFLFIAKP